MSNTGITKQLKLGENVIYPISITDNILLEDGTKLTDVLPKTSEGLTALGLFSTDAEGRLTINGVAYAKSSDIENLSTSYEDLENKPTIEGVTLSGAITLADLGAQASADAVKVSQKVVLNVTSGQEIVIDNVNTDKVLVQVWKFVEGQENVVQTVKTFNNTNASNFYYNPDTIEFGESSVSIKDTYTYPTTLNNDTGFYETGFIDKSQFSSINSINVTEVTE